MYKELTKNMLLNLPKQNAALVRTVICLPICCAVWQNFVVFWWNKLRKLLIPSTWFFKILQNSVIQGSKWEDRLQFWPQSICTRQIHLVRDMQCGTAFMPPPSLIWHHDYFARVGVNDRAPLPRRQPPTLSVIIGGKRAATICMLSSSYSEKGWDKIVSKYVTEYHTFLMGFSTLTTLGFSTFTGARRMLWTYDVVYH